MMRFVPLACLAILLSATCASAASITIDENDKNVFTQDPAGTALAAGIVWICEPAKPPVAPALGCTISDAVQFTDKIGRMISDTEVPPDDDAADKSNLATFLTLHPPKAGDTFLVEDDKGLASYTPV